MAAKSEQVTSIVIDKIKTEYLAVVLVGTSPLIMNRMSEKVKRELLAPKGRKTSAEKLGSIKHDPLAEYRASAYLVPEGDSLLAVMSSAVKGALATAALDIPGAKKAQIGRLVTVLSEYSPVFGIPKLFMSVTRMADMNKTPDVRTRVIVPHWAVVAKIQYVTPLINATSVLNLMAAAGTTVGIGDWRPEKGKGSYGQFRVTDGNDPEFQAIVAESGREVQQDALDSPECYNQETQELLEWYDVEIVRQGKVKA